jgi:hypothetical protein
VKRWVAAAVAVLFLSTATLHVFAHHGDADAGCTVCQVQQTSLPSAPAPAIAAVPVPVVALAEVPAPSFVSTRPVAAAARAPPALPA